MSEKEAWLWTAAWIDGAPDFMASMRIYGLCSFISELQWAGAISTRTERAMYGKIRRQLRERRSQWGAYIERPGDWKARLLICLKFAEET